MHGSSWLACFAIAVPAGSIAAQTVIHSWSTPGVPIGDVDGDGVRDWVEYQWSWYTVYNIHSGRTGALLVQYTPVAPSLQSVLLGDVGDVDGDGRDDLAFRVRTSPTSATYQVRVISPYSGVQLHAVPVLDPPAVATVYTLRLSDLNGDGKAEFAIGCFAATVMGVSAAGRLDVHDGATGSILRTESGTVALQYYAASGVGDLDGDGKLDYVVVGNTSCTAKSSVSGLPLYSFPCTGSSSVVSVGDVNADGRDDYARNYTIVPSKAFDVHGFEIRSGMNGATLWSASSSPSAPGYESAGGGADFDGDGYCDFVVSGAVSTAVSTVISGRTFTPLLAFASSQGYAGSSPGDADGDGVPDLWFSPGSGYPTQIVSGLVPGEAVFGQSCPDTTGERPVIGVTGGARIGTTMLLNMSNGNPTTQVAVLGSGYSNTSWNGAPLPIDLGTLGYAGLAGCFWSVGAQQQLQPPMVALAGARKASRYGVGVPLNPLLLGLDVFWQWGVFEWSPRGPIGAVTRGVRTRVVQ